jgi:hypothetical protein
MAAGRLTDIGSLVREGWSYASAVSGRFLQTGGNGFEFNCLLMYQFHFAYDHIFYKYTFSLSEYNV